MEKIYKIEKRFEQSVILQFLKRKDGLFTVRMYVLSTKKIVEIKGGFTEEFCKKDIEEKKKNGYKVTEMPNTMSFLIH